MNLNSNSLFLPHAALAKSHQKVLMFLFQFIYLNNAQCPPKIFCTFQAPMLFIVVDYEQYVHIFMINFFLFIARDLTYHLVHVNTLPLSHTSVLSVNVVSLLVSELICVIQDLGISTWHLFSLPMTIVMEILSILQHSQILPLWVGEEKSHAPTFNVCSRLLNKLWHLLCPV